MNQILQQTTPEEQIRNSRALDFLIFMMLEPNVIGLRNILHSDGRFVGKSKLFFISGLQKFFDELHQNEFRVKLKNGISTGILPGSEVVEFKYLIGDEDSFDDFGEDPFCNHPEPRHHREVVIRFCAEYKDGRIYKLYRPNTFVMLDEEEGLGDFKWN